ncbi:MAG: TrkA C-terminal domain-containing protein [Desulfobacteraceae bacterium]
MVTGDEPICGPQRLSKFISWALKRYKRLEIRDFANLLRLTWDYRANEFQGDPEGWIVNQRLGDLRLRNEGIVVLGITREDGTYIGAPDGSTKVRSKDRMILYGRAAALDKLERRKKGESGDREYDKACEEQEEIERREELEDPAEREKSGA